MPNTLICAKNIHAGTPDEAKHEHVSCWLEPGHEGECKGFWRIAIEALQKGEVTRGDFTDLCDAMTLKPDGTLKGMS